MPIQTWRSYATKIRKKPKSDFREYTNRNQDRTPSSAKYSDCLEQSRKKEKEEEMIDPLSGRLSPPHLGSIIIEKIQLVNEKESCIPNGTPLAPAYRCMITENSEDVNMKLRPPIEVYESLDDEIEKHLQRANAQVIKDKKEVKARKTKKSPK